MGGSFSKKSVKFWQMDGFARKILLDRRVQEQKLAKNVRWIGLNVKFWQIDEFKSKNWQKIWQIDWSGQKVLVDGQVSRPNLKSSICSQYNRIPKKSHIAVYMEVFYCLQYNTTYFFCSDGGRGGVIQLTRDAIVDKV